VKQLYADPHYQPKKSDLRELVESGGDPWIKVSIGADDVVHIQAAGIDEQNVIPILARIVKAYATAEVE
jgi:hypothetical protein